MEGRWSMDARATADSIVARQIRRDQDATILKPWSQEHPGHRPWFEHERIVRAQMEAAVRRRCRDDL